MAGKGRTPVPLFLLFVVLVFVVGLVFTAHLKKNAEYGFSDLEIQSVESTINLERSL